MISIYIIETLSLVSPPLARKESDDYIASGLMHSLMFFLLSRAGPSLFKLRGNI